jgi:signal peptidase I
MTRSGRLGPTGPPPGWEDRPDGPRGQEQPRSRHRAEDGYGADQSEYDGGQYQNGNGAAYGRNGYQDSGSAHDPEYGQNGYAQNGYGQNGYGQNGYANGYPAQDYPHNGYPQNGNPPNGNGYNGYEQNGYNGYPPARPDDTPPPRYEQYERPYEREQPRPGRPDYDDPYFGQPPAIDVRGYAQRAPEAYGYDGYGSPQATPPRPYPEPNGYNGQVNGYAPELPRGYDTGRPVQPVAGAGIAEPTELLHRYVPANEVLDREKRSLTPQRMARAETRRAHPPRAVVRRRRARRRAMEWPVLIAFALVAAFVIRTFALQTFYIPSGSMHETLLEGDRVLVNKISYHLHAPNRGDVVVFTTPPAFKSIIEDDDLIKRVVALPGETVEGHDRKVWINGKALSEPYVEPTCNGTDDFDKFTIPAGDVWVMGDNRCDSYDSRKFGPILQSSIVGRAFTLVWPPGRVAWL